MLSGFSEAVILGETNYIRFEKFCLALCEAVENRTFLPTSVTWDQGRDARSMGPAIGSHPSIICATLDKTLTKRCDEISSKPRAPPALIALYTVVPKN